MTTAETKKFTYQDYLNTPDDARYELIEGQLIMMTPAPTSRHQKISKEILVILDKFVKEYNLGEIYHAPYDVVLDNENVVQPDLVFIAKEHLHLIHEKNLQGSPDLVIEIISESTGYRDMIQKKQLYARFGIHEYWIVIPEEASIEVYTLKDNHYEFHKKYLINDILSSPLLPPPM